MSELVVHNLASAWGLPSVSPFCLKLDAYLRLTEIPFRPVVDATPFAAPKGKTPWIEHDGRKIGDSGFIIDYLRSHFGVDPDAGLSPSERAISLALRRLIEENLYWTLVYDRWIVDRNWPTTRDVVLAGVPGPVRQMIAPIARRSVRRQLRGHGLGLHSAEEIHAIGRRDVGALGDVLGAKSFFMGETPTEIDAIAYGFLANLIHAPTITPVRDDLAGRENLIHFVERFKGRYYP